MLSLMNTPGTGGTQLSGTATMRTSMSALRFRREISDMACRWRSAVRVAERELSSMLRAMMSGQRARTTAGAMRTWLLKITQKRIFGIGRPG